VEKKYRRIMRYIARYYCEDVDGVSIKKEEKCIAKEFPPRAWHEFDATNK
jgi:hypothetical protein